ncbi:MAG TPA: glycosyltransferase family 87 protein [Gemmataceae bacterium]|nr:glycosyltransferase family 87 protein [Gemmataceae bacterium]
MVVILIRSYLYPTRNTVYPIFATAAREWGQGVDMYDLTIPRDHNERFRYAPIVAVALTPYTLLPDEVGGVIWRLFNLGICCAGAVAFTYCVFPGPARLNGKAAAVLALLVLPLSIGSINNAQANVLVVGCLLLAAAAVVQRRWTWSAAVLAVAILFKIYPLSVAGLLLLVRPRLGWRLGLAMAAGLLAPFCLGDPAYVTQSYASWIGQLAADHRHDWPMENSYRDFHVLTRAVGLSLPDAGYQALQLLMAALAATAVVRGHVQRWSTARHARAAFDLGCCWIVLFGPATENCTYALLAPTAALATWEAFQDGQPVWKRLLMIAAAAVFLGTMLIMMLTPYGKYVSCVSMPLAGLLVLIERVLSTLAPAADLTKSSRPVEALAPAA